MVQEARVTPRELRTGGGSWMAPDLTVPKHKQPLSQQKSSFPSRYYTNMRRYDKF